MIVSVRWSAVW